MKDWSEFQHSKATVVRCGFASTRGCFDNFRFHSLPDASRAQASAHALVASERKQRPRQWNYSTGTDEEIAFRDSPAL